MFFDAFLFILNFIGHYGEKLKPHIMKKTIVFWCILLFVGCLHAQITINSNDMPSAGESVRTSITFDFLSYDFEETGNDHNWDFSDLSGITQRESTFIGVTQTPPVFWPFFLGSANLATEIQELSAFPELPVDGGYQFYQKTAVQYADVGLGILVGGLPVPLKFNNSDVLYRFPMTVGYSDTTFADLSVGFPDIGHVTIERERVSEVDGWGTLHTPYGSFETLRIKSMVSEYDSLYIDSLGQGFAINRFYTEYKWLGKGHGLPLLAVTDDPVFGSSIAYIDSLRIMPPGDFVATAINSSQIDLEWQLNFENNDVLLAWADNNVFGNPSGNYNPGDDIAGGGKVLYAGSATAFIHNELTPDTQYYYKIWSYHDNNYSAGITAETITLPETDIPGDANCDGVVNVLDVIAIANYYAGDIPDLFCFDNADVNGDGIIDVLDIIGTIEIFNNPDY